MRYTGPTTRINRRFKEALFPITKGYERKLYFPGMHGARLKRRVTDYSQSLNEKQKMCYLFGLSENQLRLVFKRAKQIHGITGEILLRLLETRLDNVVYSMGFAKTRRAARQMVSHGHIRVNGAKVNRPSYTCMQGESIMVSEKTSARRLAMRALEETQGRNCPSWITVEGNQLKGMINRLPMPEEMVNNVNVQLIVEYYNH